MSGYQFDQSFIQDSCRVLAGVDEAGRGPLAGPLVVAAVILPSNPEIPVLSDSKLIPPEQREALFVEISEVAISSFIVIIEPDEIDRLNIFQATMKGMKEALNGLSIKPDLSLIDGNHCPKSGYQERAIVKGDVKSASIAAASILAKVTRDLIMVELSEQYPHYGFDGHKGYGSKEHIEAIKKYGPCPQHRKSFEPVKSMTQKELIFN